MSSPAPTPPPPPSSSFPYPAGAHSWQNFRLRALAPRQIRLHDPSPAVEVPSSLLLDIHTSLDGLNRFDLPRNEFRCQVENSKCFSDSPVFPPNVLPPLEKHSDVQRVTSPKWISREALPVRAPPEPTPLPEIPSPRHNLACGFTGDSFTELEREALPASLGITGTIVHFVDGLVSPGIPIYAPFMVFERSKGMTEDKIEAARNQCAIGGSACVRAYKMLYNRAHGEEDTTEKHVAFSCIVDNSFAILNYHWQESEDDYHMSPLCKFDLTQNDHFNKFQAWIQAIECWACKKLLPKIKLSLNKLVSYDTSPPLSPIPSLSLSIDTSSGGDEPIMKALRSTFDGIQWRYSSAAETPIRSAGANCGTPLPARQVRAMAMSPLTPESAGLRRQPQSYSFDPGTNLVWPPTPPYRKSFDLSPLRLTSMPVSPARPGETLSPCSPPLEAPSSTRNPMLVLQRRLDHAMDEIKDLKWQLDQANVQRRVKKAEMTQDMKEVALELFESLLKQTEDERRQRSPAASPASSRSRRSPPWSPISPIEARPPSLKQLLQTAITCLYSKYLALIISLAVATSLLFIGRLFGYKISDTVSCLVPSFLSPGRLAGPSWSSRSSNGATWMKWLSSP